MLKIYDKAQWHIDGGENADLVIAKFKLVFAFLADKNLLTIEGKEILEIGVDSSVSLNERMVSEEGKKFLADVYDDIAGLDCNEIVSALEKKYVAH